WSNGDPLSDRIVIGAGFFFQAEDGIRDRNVTGVQTCALPISFLVAGAITGGDLTIKNCLAGHLGAVIARLQQTGVRIDTVDATTIHVRGARKLVGADVNTEEYPGFATDMQAQYMALATQAEGTSVITETIFENRYLHASEMARMGGNISVEGRRAVVRGPAQLSGTTVQASDLRASAGLVLAGLVASGETLIRSEEHTSELQSRFDLVCRL